MFVCVIAYRVLFRLWFIIVYLAFSFQFSRIFFWVLNRYSSRYSKGSFYPFLNLAYVLYCIFKVCQGESWPVVWRQSRICGLGIWVLRLIIYVSWKIIKIRVYSVYSAFIYTILCVFTDQSKEVKNLVNSRIRNELILNSRSIFYLFGINLWMQNMLWYF